MRRLKAAVAKGEMSGPEARMKWAEAEVKQAVVDGKISGQDARVRLREMREAIAKRRGHTQDDLDWDNVQRRIEGAVERGDMTREEADAKYREIKQRMAREERESDDFNWDKVKRRIEGAVERGDMTRQEADKKYREIKQRRSQEDED